jgi:hypothetical protein
MPLRDRDALPVFMAGIGFFCIILIIFLGIGLILIAKHYF